MVSSETDIKWWLLCPGVQKGTLPWFHILSLKLRPFELDSSKSSIAFALRTYQIFLTNKGTSTAWGILILLYPASIRWHNCGIHSIKYLGLTLWCHLPRDIRNVTNLNHFKKLIRQEDLSTLVTNVDLTVFSEDHRHSILTEYY